MYKLLFVIPLLICVFLIPSREVYSQEPNALEKDYEIAFDEYQIKLDDYKSSHEDYVLAKSQYVRFETLTSQNNAKTATREMLEARDQVVISYLVALKKKLIATESSETEKKERLISQLDEEVNWFTGHKELLASAGSLEDLVVDSNEAQDRYLLFGPIAYEVLSFVPYSHVVRLDERLKGNFSDTKTLVGQIRDESRPDYKFSIEKLERIDKWTYDTESKIQRGGEKLSVAKTTLESIASKLVVGDVRSYERVLRELEQSIQDMKDASLYTREIIKEVKTK